MEKINKEKQIIYYANIISRLKTKFSIEEEKALHLIFKQINAFEKNDLTIKLNKSDFFDKLELKSTNRYNRYRNLIRGLIQKTYVELIDEKGKEILGVVINASSWNSKEPFFEVDLTPRFMPFIEQLVRDYTKVDLYSILGFKSKHSLTLYKFLCSWTDENKKINQIYITTKELKELLGLSKEAYMQGNKFNRASFERETITKAINEINKISNINVFFKKNKENGKVKNYEFTWTHKEKPNAYNHTKQNANKCHSLNDKQTQMLLDNIDMALKFKTTLKTTNISDLRAY